MYARSTAFSGPRTGEIGGVSGLCRGCSRNTLIWCWKPTVTQQ